MNNSGYDEGASASEGGAKKMASRDLKSIEQAFGLSGTEAAGYQLGMSFQSPRAYLRMFKHWLQWLQRYNNSPDTVLMIMLEGLVAAIESAFTDDPICIPNLETFYFHPYARYANPHLPGWKYQQIKREYA